MDVILTNLSNDIFDLSRKKLNKSALDHGINKINSYSYNDILQTNFYHENIKILSQERGIGYWLWKPYIILDTFKKYEKGDIVIYSDSGIEIIESLEPLVQIVNTETDILLFANSNYLNKKWTKRDCFVLMNCDEEKYWNGSHTDAAFCIFRITERSRLFLEEWLKFCSNINILTDISNITGKHNFPEFSEHRRDQSILSLLAIKFNLPLFRMPTQFGNHYKMEEFRVNKEFNCLNQEDQTQLSYYSASPYKNSFYFQLLNHHREMIIDYSTLVENISVNKDITSLAKLNLFFKRTIKTVYHAIETRAYNLFLINGMRSYSQCGEDILVNYIFNLRGIEKPSYIDIGANHPYFLNNTAMFYNRGSTGINIEANPTLLPAFHRHRPKDINLNIGIGEIEEELNFYIMADETLSTFSEKEYETMVKHEKVLKGIKKIKLTTISLILDKYMNGLFPDFLSLDAEGMDFMILKSINYELSYPKVICVEAADYSPIGAGKRREDLINFLKSKGYYEYANTNLNAIMVKNEFWFI